MLYELIENKDLFKECLKIYLTKYQYGNTRTENLLQVMTEVSGKDVIGIMTPWLS